jgi:hypothetical protein
MSADRSCSRSGSADATQFPPADRCPKGDARRVLAVADANLAGLRIYDLRHTAVVLWIVAGASPKEVAARGDTPR